jgi:D-lactate dehydrogenase
MKIAFFETENWEVDYLKESLKDHEIDFFEERLDKDNLPEKRDYEVLLVFSNCELTKEVIEAFPNLKLIATRSTGYDHIDLRAAEEKGVTVSNVPNYGQNTVAEFTFGLILTLSRKIFNSYDRIRETGSFDFNGLQGFDLKGKTIGVVGTGKIGKHVVKMARGFEMNIIAFDAYPDEKFAGENDVKYVSFEELLGQSDVITFHVPELPSTFHMINMENIDLIKKGAIVINTARGSVIETEALVKALHSGILKGAGLDVLEEEVSTKDELEFLISGKPEEHDLKIILSNHMLIDMDNVVITPHTAFFTKEAMARILDTTVLSINSFIAGSPQNEVKRK